MEGTVKSQLLVHPKGVRNLDFRYESGVYDKSAPHGTLVMGLQSHASGTGAHIEFTPTPAFCSASDSRPGSLSSRQQEKKDFTSNYINFLFDFNNTVIPLVNLLPAKLNYIMPHIVPSVFRHSTIQGRLCIISIYKNSVIYSDLTYDIKIFNNSISNYRVEKHENDYLIIATESITDKICWHFIGAKTTHFYNASSSTVHTEL